MWPKHVLFHRILTLLTWALRPGDEGTEDEMIFKTPFSESLGQTTNGHQKSDPVALMEPFGTEPQASNNTNQRLLGFPKGH